MIDNQQPSQSATCCSIGRFCCVCRALGVIGYEWGPRLNLNTVFSSALTGKGKWNMLLLLTTEPSKTIQSPTSQSVVDITQRSLTYNLEAVLNHLRECYVEFSYKPQATAASSHNASCQFVSQRVSVVPSEESSHRLWEAKWPLCEVHIITCYHPAAGQCSIPWFECM